MVISKKGGTRKGASPSKRSHFGCANCKAKRTKCDEKKPECSRCQTKGLVCRYGVRLHFREDYESIGKKFGREGVWKKNSSSNPTSKQLALQFRAAFYVDITNANLQFINFRPQDFISGLPRTRIRHRFLDQIENGSGYIADWQLWSYALNYYIEFVSPILNPASTICSSKTSAFESGLLQGVVFEQGLNLKFLIQYAHQKPDILVLVLALGSKYISRIVQEDQKHVWADLASAFKLIACASICPSSSVGTDTLFSLVLLMLYELADGRQELWRANLKHCKQILSSESFKRPNNELELSLLSFSLELLNYQESMGRTACKDDNSFFALEDVLEDAAPSKVSWMGCNKVLVDTISDITDLSFERNQMKPGDYSVLCNTIGQNLQSADLGFKLEHHLCDLGQGSSLYVPIDPTINVEELGFLLACDAKRLSTLLYFECCLLDAHPEKTEVQILVKEIFCILDYTILQNDFKWVSTLLWTVFIAASQISPNIMESDDFRYKTMQMLDRIEAYCLGNVRDVKEILMHIWKKRDLFNADDSSMGDLKISGKNLSKLNDWDTFVSNKSYNISLA